MAMRTTALIASKDVGRFLGTKEEGNEPFIQGIIVFSSCITIWLLANPGDIEVARWGFLTGLVGQPFWIVSTIRKRQWGIFLVTLFYTGVFVKGLLQYWF